MGGQIAKLAFPGVPGLETEPPPDVVWIDTEHYRVPALWCPHPRARAVIVYTHGNAMTVSQMRPLISSLSQALRVHVLVPEIPGTQYDWGRLAFKSGEPEPASEASYFEAALGAFDFAEQKAEGLPVVSWGQSLGSGPACETGVRRKPSAVVLQSPLLSCIRVVLSFSVWPLDMMQNEGKVRRFSCPTLVVHGARDCVINVAHGRRLAEVLTESNRLHKYVELQEADHNDVEHLYWDQLVAAVDELLIQIETRT